MSSPQRDSGEFGALAGAEGPFETDSEPATEAGPRIVVRGAGRTAVGQVRDHNEDNFVVANLETGEVRPRDQVVEDTIGERGMVFAVCDGMGGAAAGEVASQMAVDILVEAMRRGGTPKNRDALARRLVQSVEEAGKRIYESAQRERSRRGMGTTATVAVLIDKVLFLAEVGDSRAYLLRRGELRQLTKDQSLVNQLIEAGHLTEAEAEAFEHSNIILQALGTSESVQVDLTFVELRRGDRLLLCSDGLSGLVHADALRSTLEEIKDQAECCSKLIEYAETAGGHDNITVVVADFDGEGLAEAGEKDAFGYVQYPLPLSDDDASAFADEDTESSAQIAARQSPAEGRGVAQAGQAAGRRERDQGESLLPLSGDAGDGQGNVLWFVGGALALAAGVAVWLMLEPGARESGAEDTATEVQNAAPEQAAASEVEVRVYTDIAGGSLLVNGENRGTLDPDQTTSLMLRPGDYHFVAQRGGSQVAASTVSVQGDTPVDVFLQGPSAAQDGQNEGRAASEPGSEPGQEKEPSAAEAAGKTPSEVEPRAHHRHRRDRTPPLAPEAPLLASPEGAAAQAMGGRAPSAPTQPATTPPAGSPVPVQKVPGTAPAAAVPAAVPSTASSAPVRNAAAGGGEEAAAAPAPAVPPPKEIPANPF